MAMTYYFGMPIALVQLKNEVWRILCLFQLDLYAGVHITGADVRFRHIYKIFILLVIALLRNQRAFEHLYREITTN